MCVEDDSASNHHIFYIAGHLNRDAKVVFLDDLISHGRGEWLDGKMKRTFLVLWKTWNEWADALYGWAVANGEIDSVVTMHDVQSGPSIAGTELANLPRTVLDKAIKVLESQGKAK